MQAATGCVLCVFRGPVKCLRMYFFFFVSLSSTPRTPSTDTRSSSITMKWNGSEDPRQNVRLWSALFFAKSKSKDSYTLKGRLRIKGRLRHHFTATSKGQSRSWLSLKNKHSFHHFHTVSVEYAALSVFFPSVCWSSIQKWHWKKKRETEIDPGQTKKRRVQIYGNDKHLAVEWNELQILIIQWRSGSVF